MTAIDAALEACLQLGEEHGKGISLLTDSMSSLMTLQQGPASQDSELGVAIWKLSQLNIPIQLIWIPAHCGIAGNEHADRAANGACALPQRAVETPLQTALALLKRERRKKDKESFREYARFSEKQDHISLGRAERVTVNQFRAGASSASKATLARMGKTEDASCDFCGEEETESHILQDCPRTEQAVVKMVGLTDMNLLERPNLLLQLLKKTGRANARTISPQSG